MCDIDHLLPVRRSSAHSRQLTLLRHTPPHAHILSVRCTHASTCSAVTAWRAKTSRNLQQHRQLAVNDGHVGAQHAPAEWNNEVNEVARELHVIQQVVYCGTFVWLWPSHYTRTQLALICWLTMNKKLQQTVMVVDVHPHCNPGWKHCVFLFHQFVCSAPWWQDYTKST